MRVKLLIIEKKLIFLLDRLNLFLGLFKILLLLCVLINHKIFQRYKGDRIEQIH
jgi:hypothetical protein